MFKDISVFIEKALFFPQRNQRFLNEIIVFLKNHSFPQEIIMFVNKSLLARGRCLAVGSLG